MKELYWRWGIVKCFSFFLFLSCNLSAQNTAVKVRERQEKNLQEIEYANKLLKETQGKTKGSLNEISIINHKLEKRKEYLSELEQEIDLLSASVEQNQNSIELINNKIKKINEIYGSLILILYENKSTNYWLMYLLASKNVNQLYRRYKIFKQYDNYLKSQKTQLKLFERELNSKNIELLNLKSEKDKVYDKARKESLQIELEIKEKRNIVNELKKKQKEIQNEIRNKENIAKKLSNELKNIILEEKKRSEKAGTKVSLTPEEEIISENFEKNIGKLPWPTLTGIITEKYGEHRHPDYSSVVVRNDGIYISTNEGESARSVFKGIISRVFTIPGENYSIIIKHGGYYTLYHNLVNVKVKAGQNVDTKQILGTVSTSKSTKETIIYFQIWKETEKLDPESWLAHN
jgi:murein hydrolase activator